MCHRDGSEQPAGWLNIVAIHRSAAPKGSLSRNGTITPMWVWAGWRAPAQPAWPSARRLTASLSAAAGHIWKTHVSGSGKPFLDSPTHSPTGTDRLIYVNIPPAPVCPPIPVRRPSSPNPPRGQTGAALSRRLCLAIPMLKRPTLQCTLSWASECMRVGASLPYAPRAGPPAHRMELPLCLRCIHGCPVSLISHLSIRRFIHQSIHHRLVRAM